MTEEFTAALKRVEAGIARLTEERSVYARKLEADVANSERARKAERSGRKAAEVETARLREGLREIATNGYGLGVDAPAYARALLADAGAKKVCPNCGRRILTDKCEACAMPEHGAA